MRAVQKLRRGGYRQRFIANIAACQEVVEQESSYWVRLAMEEVRPATESGTTAYAAVLVVEPVEAE